MIKCSDYIVRFLMSKNITDIFGYPGGMVTHLMDSLRKFSPDVRSHLCYHEQAASLAACGYAQTSGKPGAAYATSGPGGVNMLSGMCNAWCDSIPVIFITGQVNRNESSAGMPLRQRGFQELNIIEMIRGVTKYAVYVDAPEKLPEYLDTAYNLAVSGRKGPVLLDVPMDVLRSQTEDKFISSPVKHANSIDIPHDVIDLLKASERPCMILGAALKDWEAAALVRKLSELLRIPCVSSMIAVDALPADCQYKFGFIGAYGSRTANFIAAKSDLIISLGTRLDIRQTGALRKDFAQDAKIIRVDIDSGELAYTVHDDDININADVKDFMNFIMNSGVNAHWDSWLQVCNEIRERLSCFDVQEENLIVEKLSGFIPDNVIITSDVGQNQVWTAQSFKNKPGQRLLFSGGFGTMGYSLPAAIGAHYASGVPVVSINGDGGFMMNIQELQFIARENLPIKIIVFNNYALGMIRHFQEMYFDRNYAYTTQQSGYSVPDFAKIAWAYGLEYFCSDGISSLDSSFMSNNNPALLEIKLAHETVITPKARYGMPAQDQEPVLDRDLYQYIMNLNVNSNERLLTNMKKCYNGFRIQDSGFRIQDSGFRIQDSGFRIQDSGFRTICRLLDIFSSTAASAAA